MWALNRCRGLKRRNKVIHFNFKADSGLLVVENSLCGFESFEASIFAVHFRNKQ